MASRHSCTTHLSFDLKEQGQWLDLDHCLPSRDHTVNSREETRFAMQGVRNLSGENYSHHKYYRLNLECPPKRFLPSLGCYWVVMENLRCGAQWKEIRQFGASPRKAYWDSGPFLSLFAPQLPSGEKLHLLCSCTMGSATTGPEQQGQVTMD
jgi:hypothetical protein